ncbi:hypothetical protein NQZ68_000020 [Dissostichus eleginoides]|nr:hypothetical protein NQZ68_000020 [Dissostichus eleginoides]
MRNDTRCCAAFNYDKGLMMSNPQCEMYVGAGGVEGAMSWSQCSLFSTGHSAREFLWAEVLSIQETKPKG